MQGALTLQTAEAARLRDEVAELRGVAERQRRADANAYAEAQRSLQGELQRAQAQAARAEAAVYAARGEVRQREADFAEVSLKLARMQTALDQALT